MSAQPSTRKQPRYIRDQGWNLLTATERPEQYLLPEYFRAGRQGQPQSSPTDVPHHPWKWINDCHDVVFDRLTDHQGQTIDLSRLVITTDAGIGKTAAVDWLTARLNQSDTGCFACKFDLGQFQLSRTRFTEQLFDQLANRWADSTHDELSRKRAKLLLMALLRQRKLVLLFDGLDQLAGRPDALQLLLNSLVWERCRFVIAGRPHALQRHWSALFKDQAWRFINVEPFDEEQQREYLGQTEDGRSRYDELAADVRPILSTPRVLSYLFEMDDRSYQDLRTASDVYYHAVDHLLHKGMSQSAAARLIGWDDKEPPAEVQASGVKTAWELLSAIAFETLVWDHPEPTADAPRSRAEDPPPQYREHIEPEVFFDEFRKRLRERCQEMRTEGRFTLNFNGLGSLNTILERGLFDADREGLDQIKFSNRTLHEFLCAYFLARHATDRDRLRLWDWIYLKDQPLTDEYYYIWQFLCEMPPAARNSQRWLAAIETLFQPCQVADTNTKSPPKYHAKRSTEMIFRAWSTLDTLCRDQRQVIARQAQTIRDTWWGEFETQILSGQQGQPRRQRATELTNSFITLPAGEFRMGAPEEKQGLSDQQRQLWKDWIDGAFANPETEIEQFVSRINFGVGRVAQRRQQEYVRQMHEIVRDRDYDRFFAQHFPTNETPVADHATPIAEFALGRTTVANAWMRLFDPTHGLRRSQTWEKYVTYSPSGDHPAIYLSWYDCWVFCKWCRWNEQSCQLPWEDQWEYAAKFHAAWDHRYWWGDEVDLHLLNCHESGLQQTTVPDSTHANPSTRIIDPDDVGLMDMLGNVYEWCQDQYRHSYQRTEADDPGEANRFRVLRGGSFYDYASIARCSYRYGYVPSFASRDGGCRVARAPIRKS